MIACADVYERIFLHPNGSIFDNQNSSKMKKDKEAQVVSIAKIAVGLLMPILVGFFLGIKIDEKLNSSPWMTLLLLLLGIGLGFGWLYRSIKQ